MAKLAATITKVVINAVDLTTWVRSATLNYSSELVDATTMGGTGTRSRIGGLKDWSLNVEFAQDFAAGGPDVTLFSLVGTTFTVEAWPTTGAIGPTNPKYTGTGILGDTSPISGSVGDLMTQSVTIQAAGTLTRVTA